MKKLFIIVSVLVILTFAISAYVYPSLPDQMTTHWGLDGQPNGYMSKFWGAFFMPLTSIFILTLFFIIPKIDPLKHNIEKFRKHFDMFIVIMTVFLLYVHTLVLLWNIGIQFNMNRFIIPIMGLLFYYLGNLLEHSERNWFIGIRTPWTLSSDKVWKKTNKVGGILFKIGGFLTLLALIIPERAILRALIPIIVGVPALIIYSYLEFQKEKVNE